MPLDGDDMNRLMIDAVMGKDAPSIPGPEAQAFFDKVKKQVDDGKDEGLAPDMLPN